MIIESLKKDPVKVRAGKAGARAKWGEQRTLRLDTLPESVRAAILAMVEAEAAARAREAAGE